MRFPVELYINYRWKTILLKFKLCHYFVSFYQFEIIDPYLIDKSTVFDFVDDSTLHLPTNQSELPFDIQLKSSNMARIDTIRACQGWSDVVTLIWATRWDHDDNLHFFDRIKFTFSEKKLWALPSASCLAPKVIW